MAFFRNKQRDKNVAYLSPFTRSASRLALDKSSFAGLTTGRRLSPPVLAPFFFLGGVAALSDAFVAKSKPEGCLRPFGI